MVSKSKGDPLSRYFKDLNESDIDSDSENSDEERDCDVNKVKVKDKDNDDSLSDNSKEPVDINEGIDPETTNNHGSDTSPPNPKAPSIQKLPSARDCLGNKNNSPAFLNLHQKREINWDNSTHLKLLSEDETQVIDYKSNAVPPPTSYEPVTDSSTKVVDSEGRKRKSSAEELEERRLSSKAFRLDGGGDTTQPRSGKEVDS